MTKVVCRSCGELYKGGPFQLRDFTDEELTCQCGGRRVLPSQAKPRKPMRRVSEKRQAEEASGARPRRRGNGLRQGKGFQASKAQRDKVRGLPCLGCRKEIPVDPAHLWPQGKGGCDHPDCVIPLCRTCHRLFDQGELELLEHLAGTEAWAVEQAHPILAHGVSPVELVRRLSGGSWAFVRCPDFDDPSTTKGLVAAPDRSAV